MIDADVLSRAGDVFDLRPLRLPEPTQLALRRACVRRAGAVIDGNRALRRLVWLARWALPDVWNAFAGSRPTAIAVLGRWPHLRGSATTAARRPAPTAVVAEHTRAVVDVPERVEAIRAAARDWAAFWDGHLDLDALAEDVADLLGDLEAANQRVDGASHRAIGYWERLYGDDPLLTSVPGMGPVIAPTVRAFFGDGTGFDDRPLSLHARPPTMPESPRRTGPRARSTSRPGRSPRRARPPCGWRSTRRPTPRGPAIPSWPPSTTG